MTSRRELLAGIAALAAGCEPARSDFPDLASVLRRFELVDLTHTLSPDSPYIHVRNATFPFRRTPIATIAERGVYANKWELTEHIGTHVDAPCHFDEVSACLEQLPISDFFVEAVVIDIAWRAAENPDTQLTVDDLATWQHAHGPLPRRCAVLMRSDWDSHWSSQAAFSNSDDDGVMHFPGFSQSLLARLAAAPEVLGIGVDTFSIDPGNDDHFDGHRVWARTRKWAAECLANLGRLPARGAYLWVGASKVERASGGPARVVAWVPRAS